MSNWNLTVRLSSGERINVSVASNATVLDTKQAIQSLRTELEATRQRLVYKGRILDDGVRTLADYGVVDQGTVFLVMSSASSGNNPRGASGTSTSSSSTNPSSTTTPTPPSATPASPTGSSIPGASNSAASNNNNPFLNPFGSNAAAGAFGGLGGMGGLNTNPPSAEQMSQMMNSPMMQSLMDNPEMMRAAMEMSMQSNPQLRQLLDNNPELRQLYNDPAMMRQAMQMMRNPGAMQQAMRSQELAMSQLENMPGGFSALSSMYRNIQEPLMEAQDAARDNSTAANANPASSAEGATGTAMPNPWGSPAPAPPPATSPRSTANNMSNPWASPATGGAGGGSSSTTNNNTNPMNNPWATMGAGGMPPLSNQAMQGLSVDQTMQALENPMVSQMISNLVDSNPDMIRQMLEQQNPMIRQMFPDTEQLNQFIRQMMTPEALRSMMQMQRAMGGAGGMGGAGMGANGMGLFGMPPMGASAPGAQQAGLDFTNLFGPQGSGANANAPPPLDFGSLMQQFQRNVELSVPGQASGMQPPNQQQHPADRYRSQLQSLRDMGFDDEQACLAVLQQNHGNLNRAVDQLLMGPPPSVASSPAPAPAPPSSDEAPPSEPKDADDKKND